MIFFPRGGKLTYDKLPPATHSMTHLMYRSPSIPPFLWQFCTKNICIIYFNFGNIAGNSAFLLSHFLIVFICFDYAELNFFVCLWESSQGGFDWIFTGVCLLTCRQRAVYRLANTSIGVCMCTYTWDIDVRPIRQSIAAINILGNLPTGWRRDERGTDYCLFFVKVVLLSKQARYVVVFAPGSKYRDATPVVFQGFLITVQGSC